MTTQQGQQPTEEEIFYTTWGQETVKNNITLCNDILKQVITISSVLLGVSIIYDHIVSSETLKIFVLLSFFVSLIVAFCGLLPYENKVRLDTPDDIKTHKSQALKHKRQHLWVSAMTIVVGFALILLELLIKTYDCHLERKPERKIVPSQKSRFLVQDSFEVHQTLVFETKLCGKCPDAFK